MMRIKGEIAHYLLTSLKIAGIISIAIVAPNLFSAFGHFYKNKKEYNEKQLKRSLAGLNKRGFVTMRQEGDKTIINLTKNGKNKILKYDLENLKIAKPKRWDKKWRIVLFDVPLSHSVNRAVFTRKLKELGFLLMQKSVWVHPYACEDEIDFVKEMYELQPFVRLVIADSIDIQEDLIHKFRLK